MDDQPHDNRVVVGMLNQRVNEASSIVQVLQQSMQKFEEKGQLLPPPLAAQIQELSQTLLELSTLNCVQGAKPASDESMAILLDPDIAMLVLGRLEERQIRSAMSACHAWHKAGARALEARTWRITHQARLEFTHGSSADGACVQCRELRFATNLSPDELLLCDMGTNRLLGYDIIHGRARILASTRGKTLGAHPRSACIFHDHVFVACQKSLHRFTVDTTDRRLAGASSEGGGVRLELSRSLGRRDFKERGSALGGNSWTEPSAAGDATGWATGASMEQLMHVVCAEPRGASLARLKEAGGATGGDGGGGNQGLLVFVTENYSGNTGHGRVLAFDASLRFLYQFGEGLKYAHARQSSQLSRMHAHALVLMIPHRACMHARRYPTSMAVCSETLYVSNWQHVDAFSFGGAAVRRFQVGLGSGPGAPPLFAPCIAGLSDAIIVLGGSTVMVISAQDARLLDSLKLPYSATTSVHSQAQICTDGNARAYVVDQGWKQGGVPRDQQPTPPTVHVLDVEPTIWLG